MTFSPNTYSQILARMLSNFVAQNTGATDLNVGSVARTLMEAAAIEDERLYVQIMEGLNDGINSSAYQAFGFALLPATSAYGTLTLTRTGGYAPDITILPAHQFKVPNTTKLYSPVSTTVWTGGAGSTTQVVTVGALNAGVTAGNTPAASITGIVTPITGVASVSNAAAFITGVDAETTDARASRFGSYVASLPRATKAAIEYGAKTAVLTDTNNFVTERVAKALGVEGSGSGTVYIYNGVGTTGGLTTSGALVTACQTVIDGTSTVPGYRAAGIPVTATAATEDPTTIKIIITTLTPGFTLAIARANALQAVKNLLAGLNIGDTLLTSALITVVKNTVGVADCVLVTPSTNTVPATGHIVVSGSITASQFVTTGVTFNVNVT